MVYRFRNNVPIIVGNQFGLYPDKPEWQIERVEEGETVYYFHIVPNGDGIHYRNTVTVTWLQTTPSVCGFAKVKYEKKPTGFQKWAKRLDNEASK